MKLLVPYDWTKGHKLASDILCLHITFSIVFHLSFFYPESIDSATERVQATVSSVFPLLPLRLSTKAVCGTKLQLSHITTQVRNAVLGGLVVTWDTQACK